jgi:transposase InsO family protein
MVRQNMSRKDTCSGLCLCGKFFQNAEKELKILGGKPSAAEIQQSGFMYLETYYNRIRIHSALDYVAPNVFNSGQVA